MPGRSSSKSMSSFLHSLRSAFIFIVSGSIHIENILVNIIHMLNISQILIRVGNIIESQKNRDIAEALGVDPQVCSNWKARNTIPWNELYKFSKEKSVSLDLLLNGQEQRLCGLPHFEEFDFIPKYKTRLSGGSGVISESDQIEANLAFRSEWVRTKGSAKDLVLFQVEGDSMYPTIHHGDVVMVDRSYNTREDIINGKIYAFSEGEYVKVKRLAVQGERIRVISDNKIADPDYPADMDFFHLIGKVVWVGHETR